MRSRVLLRFVGTLVSGILAAAACGGEEQPAVEPASATPTKMQTTSATASPLLPIAPLVLGDALAGGETLANAALREPNLFYAVKAGRLVTVFKRNVLTGEQNVLLEYDEEIEAEHSGNTWREALPSVSLDLRDPRLIFISTDGIATQHLETGATALPFRRENCDRSQSPPFRWVSDQGAELGCTHGLALPVASESLVAASTIHYEGQGNAVFAPDGSAACIVEGNSGALDPVWSNAGDLAIPSGGEYTDDGLFVAPSGDECSAKNITPNAQQTYLGFEMAAWSPDGQWLVGSSGNNQGNTSGLTLVLMRTDGSDQGVLVMDGFNLWPIFSKNGDAIYFAKRSQLHSFAPDVSEVLWQFDIASATAQPVVELPGGWFARPRGWTDEGYLVISAYRSRDESCAYASCGNRVILFDVNSKHVVYASGPRDFTAYLGFLP